MRKFCTHLFIGVFLLGLPNSNYAVECPEYPVLQYNANHSRLFNTNLHKYLIDTVSCQDLLSISNQFRDKVCEPCTFGFRVESQEKFDLSLFVKGVDYTILKDNKGNVASPLHQNAIRSLYQIKQEEKNLKTYYLELYSKSIGEVEITALSDDRVMREKFLLDSNINALWNAMAFAFLGALFVVFLVNMVSYTFNRRPEILWYGLYAVALFFFFSIKTIISYNVESSIDLNLLELCLQPVFLIAYAQFVRTFTNSKEKYPLMDKVLKAFNWMLGIAMVLIILSGLAELHIMTQAVWYIYRTLSIFIAIGIIIYYYLHRDNIVMFVVSGSTALLVGSSLAMFLSIGKIYVGPIAPIHWMMIGILIELVIFSGGVGYRMLLNTKEKLKYQSALISEMEKNTKLGEIKQEELSRQVEIAVSRMRQEEKEKTAAKLSYKERDTELQLLRAQMNPHFIFNSLNSVKSFIIKNNPRAAGDYLSKFAHLMRMILSNSKRHTVSLTNELETLKVYITLEQMRFSESFDYTIEIDEQVITDDVEVLPLLLQPFVENAIWHGLLHKDGKGTIFLYIHKMGDHIRIKIEDDGIGREASARIKMNGTKKQKSFGMDISKDRLKHFYGEDYQVRFEDKYDKGEGTGTIVTIVIPQTTNVYAST